jgi:hypothetical protein
MNIPQNTAPHAGEAPLLFAPGTIIAGRYVLETLLGRGGMGEVWRAAHASLGHTVAVKFLLGPAEQASEFRARFVREAQLLARVQHPNVVAIHDFGIHGPSAFEAVPFLVMEEVHGEPLADLFGPDRNPLPTTRIAGLFDQILSVLESLHGAGIVHRDLKPENVMRLALAGREDHVKVLDFGLAVSTAQEDAGSRITREGTFQGTPVYMSPEQFQGREIGPAADIYAVGCMLHEAFTGLPPFDAPDLGGLLAAHVLLEPPPMADHGRRPEVSVGLEKVVAKALAKSPDQRWTAHEFRVALSSAVRGTDADTLVALATAERLRAAGLSREERALTGSFQQRGAGSATMNALPEGTPPRVIFWTKSSEETLALRDATSVAGCRARIHDGDELPPAFFGDEPVRVLVLVMGEGDDAVARLTRLKESPVHQKIPTIVVFRGNAAAIPTWIRAGAADAIGENEAREGLVRRVLRLVKRGR